MKPDLRPHVFFIGLMLCVLGYVGITMHFFNRSVHSSKFKNRTVVVHEYVQEDRFVYTGPVRGDPNIMFVETSCVFVQQRHHLSARQACSVASAARKHPHHRILLFYTCKTDYDVMVAIHPDPYMKELLRYNNVYLTFMNASKMVVGSPLEEWWRTQPLNQSDWPIHHASDALRLLLLWKYGGVYIDLDFIIVRSLPKAPSFIGLEDKGLVGSSLVGLEATEQGRHKAEELIEELTKTYSPHVWGYNGPALFTRVMKRHCSDLDLVANNNNTCDGIKILVPIHFFLYHFREAALLLRKEKNLLYWVRNDPRIRAVHLWNFNSGKFSIETRSNQLYAHLAKKYCPKVYTNSGDSF